MLNQFRSARKLNECINQAETLEAGKGYSFERAQKQNKNTENK